MVNAVLRGPWVVLVLISAALAGCGGAGQTRADVAGSGTEQTGSARADARPQQMLAQQPDARVRIFERITEPREGAFTMLVPRGWAVEGGIFRVDPTAAGGPAQSIEAKLDMTVKRDAAGTVMGRVLPDMRYIDMRYSPAGQMGLFPPGSNYNGMLVAVFPGAANFAVRSAFPYAHPHATNVTVGSSTPAPALAQRYQQSLASLLLPSPPACDAAVVTFSYDEGGVRYRELWSAVLVNWGQVGAGMWENKETRFMRAPEGEFDAWVPTFAAMQASLQINPRWMAGEIEEQIRRNQIMIDTQQEVQRLEREIVANRQKVNAEIQNSMYLTLTGQQDYRNPFTGEFETRRVELGKYRWVNDLGHEIFADRDIYNPNDDVNVYQKGFRRSEPRR